MDDEAFGYGDLSHLALAEAMVRGGPEVWEAVTSFCEAVMLAKVVEHELEWLALPTHASTVAKGDALCAGSHATISDHRRRGLAGGEQRVACRLIRTEPVSRRRQHSLKGPDNGPTICRGRGIRSNQTAYPGTWAIQGTYRVFLVSRSLKLPAAPP